MIRDITLFIEGQISEEVKKIFFFPQHFECIVPLSSELHYFW